MRIQGDLTLARKFIIGSQDVVVLSGNLELDGTIGSHVRLSNNSGSIHIVTLPTSLNSTTSEITVITNLSTSSESFYVSSTNTTLSENVLITPGESYRFIFSGTFWYHIGVTKNDLNNFVTEDDWGQNGYDDKDDSTISFTDSTRTFSIQPTVTNFSYWVSGVKYISTGDTVIIGGGTVADEGIWIIYYDDDVLTSIQNPTNSELSVIIQTKAITCIVYWNATDEESIYVGEERHGKDMSPSTHNYLHFYEGLRYFSGLSLTDVIADGNGDLDTSAQFGVEAGNVADEDLAKRISAVISTVGLPIYYMLGSTGRWVRHIEPGFSVRTFDGTDTTRLAWNEYTGGAWQLTEITNKDFVLYHIFATTEKDAPMISIMGQNDYTSKKNARAGALLEIQTLITNDLLFPEIRPIATIIFESQDGYNNTVKSRIVTDDDGGDYVDWRSETVTRNAISTSNHADLINLPFSLSGHTWDADVDLGSYDLYAKELISVNSGTINKTSGEITSVVITGGRTLTPTRTNGLITSITDGTRTWTFTYTDGLITSWSVI